LLVEALHVVLLPLGEGLMLLVTRIFARATSDAHVSVPNVS
jgi:hypothetical protein